MCAQAIATAPAAYAARTRSNTNAQYRGNGCCMSGKQQQGCHPMNVRPLAHNSGVVRRHTHDVRMQQPASQITGRLQTRHRHGWRRPVNPHERKAFQTQGQCTGASVNPRSKKSCSRQGGAQPQLVSVHTTAPQEGWGWIRNSPNKHSTERSGHSHPIRLRAAQRS